MNPAIDCSILRILDSVAAFRKKMLSLLVKVTVIEEHFLKKILNHEKNKIHVDPGDCI